MPTSGFSSLFVYGTLMRGEVNAARLASARYVGPARTVAGYSLVALAGYPGLRPGGREGVVGEVYLVDAPLLAALDECLKTLVERARLALDQRYRQQQSRREIAAALNLTEDGAKNLLQRAKQQLRICIAGKMQ